MSKAAVEFMAELAKWERDVARLKRACLAFDDEGYPTIRWLSRRLRMRHQSVIELVECTEHFDLLVAWRAGSGIASIEHPAEYMVEYYEEEDQ